MDLRPRCTHTHTHMAAGGGKQVYLKPLHVRCLICGFFAYAARSYHFFFCGQCPRGDLRDPPPIVSRTGGTLGSNITLCKHAEELFFFSLFVSVFHHNMLQAWWFGRSIGFGVYVLIRYRTRRYPPSSIVELHIEFIISVDWRAPMYYC